MRLVWKQLPLASNNPTAQTALKRSSNNLAVVGNKAYVYGGEAKPREPVDDELWVVDLDSEFSLSFITHMCLFWVDQLISGFVYSSSISRRCPTSSNETQTVRPGRIGPHSFRLQVVPLGRQGVERDDPL